MKTRLFYKNFFVVLGVDILLLSLAFYLSHFVRFDFNIPDDFWRSLYKALPLVLITKLICFYFFDLYRGMWRYTSINDMFNVSKAAFISSLIIISFLLFTNRFKGFSRSIFLMDFFFTFIFIAGFRISVRVIYEQSIEGNPWKNTLKAIFGVLARKRTNSKNLLIIGAGDCGEKIYREIRDNLKLPYNVVGFIDDNPVKMGRKIHGIPVLSDISGLNYAVKSVHAEEVLIAIPSASSQQMRRIIENCKKSRIRFKTIPGYGELLDGRVSVNSIREVAYRDLLGRELVKLDEEKIGSYLKGQIILVTGAGGSIGSELCRQICRFQPEKLVLYERAESALYDLSLDLKQNYNDIEIVSHLADIRDMHQLEKAFDAFKPQVVFHAAAYKHVPMLELQPWKAIKNNITGTRNLIEISNRCKVKRFVLVSTDKAVKPTNVMGASKRVAELLSQNQNGNNETETQFMIVRFGNVVGSAGSVVPLFKKQIAKGGPVTVTHPDVTRFFMMIPEACQLILQAGAMGNGGEIFILKMGTSIKIDDMARDLIRLSGFEPDIDIKIEYTGLRPGEKLFEELITEGENIVPTNHDKILVLKGKEQNLTIMNGKIEQLESLADDQNSEMIKTILNKIIPEYQPERNVDSTRK